jgi:hypothetical protein
MVHLAGYLYEDYHDARSLEHKGNLITPNSHRKYLRVRHVVTDCKQNQKG